MPNRHFLKELENQPVWIRGAPIRFDILETDDPILIEELDNCIRGARGGIVSISEEQYAVELKKKENAKSSASSSSSQPWRKELSSPEALRAAVHQGGSFARPQEPRPFNQFAMQQTPRLAPAEMPAPLAVPDASEFVLKPAPTAKLKKPKP